MRFPEKEVEVAALAVAVAEGMAAAPSEYPHPPVPPKTLLALQQKYQNLKERTAAAQAALGELHEEKDDVYSKMKAGTTQNLRYGEIQARGRKRPEMLTGLGWAAPHQKRSLALPGEVRDITVGEQGETTVGLSWQKPARGGTVASYVVERRTKGGKWGTVATTGDLKILLEDQPRGLDLEYRVRTINRTGKGPVSGTVYVVL
jgi:hypothetical protein